MTDPYAQNPAMVQGNPDPNYLRQGSVINRIPQYFYPRYENPNDSYLMPANYDQPYYPAYEPPQPPPVQPQTYPQSMPIATNPYTPYPAPYLIPLANNVRVDPAPPQVPPQDQNKADILASHKKDADLSRLEVYHFTPKPNPITAAGGAAPPIIQYHVYSYPPGNSGPPTSQQPPTSSNPWYGNQPTVVPPTEFNQPFSSVEKKARGIQTEPADMRTRGVSPLFTEERRSFVDTGFPRAQQVVAYNDRYDAPRKRHRSRHYYDEGSVTPLDDCRCLDCRRERERVLNYYED